MRLFSLEMLAAAVLLGCPAMSDSAMSASKPKADLVDVIPYRPDGKLMSVQVSVNGAAPVWFCVDSGAPHSVIDPRLAAQLNLKSVGAGSVTGTGQGAVAVANLEPVTLRLAGIAVIVDAPYGIDLSNVPIAKDTRGLLGFDAFDQYVLRFDPVGHTISFYDRAKFVLPAAGAAIPLIVDRRKLYIDARLDVKPGLSVTHRLRVDLGSEESVNDEIVAQSRETRITKLGGGLGADFEGVSGVFDAVHIGPYQFKRVWGPGAPGPAVGMEIFRRFVSTFDAGRGILYLTPTPALTEPVPPPDG